MRNASGEIQSQAGAKDNDNNFVVRSFPLCFFAVQILPIRILNSESLVAPNQPRGEALRGFVISQPCNPGVLVPAFFRVFRVFRG